MAQCSDAGQERPMDCPHFDFKERQQLFHHDPSDFTDAFIKLKLFCFYSENNSASCQHHYSRLQRFAKAFDYTKVWTVFLNQNHYFAGLVCKFASRRLITSDFHCESSEVVQLVTTGRGQPSAENDVPNYDN
eukprot:m.86099 g.86099  ORF g.86099 m.86099 type:complete len:132 (+) comp36489_c0_seq4:419-814(+)